MVIFTSFVMAGLLPPFSAFFLAILEYFDIQLLHLAQYSIMILAIFAHLCEMFMGVLPSVALFHHYFVLRSARKNNVTGSYNFCLRDGLMKEYIPQTL